MSVPHVNVLLCREDQPVMREQSRAAALQIQLSSKLLRAPPPRGFDLKHDLSQLTLHPLCERLESEGRGEEGGGGITTQLLQPGGGEEAQGQRRVESAPLPQRERVGMGSIAQPAPPACTAERQFPRFGEREAPQVRVEPYRQVNREVRRVAVRSERVRLVREAGGYVQHLNKGGA